MGRPIHHPFTLDARVVRNIIATCLACVHTVSPMCVWPSRVRSSVTPLTQDTEPVSLLDLFHTLSLHYTTGAFAAPTNPAANNATFAKGAYVIAPPTRPLAPTPCSRAP